MGCFVCQRPFYRLIQGMYEKKILNKNHKLRDWQWKLHLRLQISILIQYQVGPKVLLPIPNTDTGTSYKNMLMGGHKSFIVF